IHTSDAPPTRKSISALGDVNPVGPHQRVTYAVSLQAFQASSTGALRTRVTTTSNVSVPSSLLLSFMVANPFLSAIPDPAPRAIVTRRCETAGALPKRS